MGLNKLADGLDWEPQASGAERAVVRFFDSSIWPFALGLPSLTWIGDNERRVSSTDILQGLRTPVITALRNPL